MGAQYLHRVLTRQWIGPGSLGDLLSTVADAAAANTPGSKIFVMDLSGNQTSFVYAGTTNLTGIAAGVPVYWTNVSRTTVSDTATSAVTAATSSDAAIFSAAGVSISALPTTAAPYAWFCCGGYLSSVPIPSSAKVGDLLVLSTSAAVAPTNDVWARVAIGTNLSTPEQISTLYCVVTSAAQTPTTSALVMGTCGLP